MYQHVQAPQHHFFSQLRDVASTCRIALLALALSALCIQHASAQAYPSKPIRAIIPYVAGGVLDVLMRNLAQQVSQSINQPIIIENRAGASSQIALAACASAAPDGYSVCTTSGEGMSFGPSFFRELPYDPDRDFVPITNLVWIPGVIAANRTYRSTLSRR
jgi:tripartite-type tricarboxylate transporter receptor subunit TctC